MQGFRTIEGRKFPAGVRHIRTVTVCAIAVPIVEGTPDQIPQLRDDDGSLLDGRFHPVSGCIFIRRGMSRTMKRDAINHEISHAFWLYSGANEYLASVARIEGEHEEMLIRMMTPHMHVIRWER